MRKWLVLCSILAVSTLAVSTSASAGELKLTMANGRVTLVADAVPVRTILQEWARLGQSKIVNAEKVVGAPLTLRLIDVPEEQALDIVLRSASGYLAAPRAVPVANASRFDRIVILATSRPTTSAAAPSPTQPQPRAQQPAFPSNAVQAPIVEDEDEPDEESSSPNPTEPPPQLPVTSDRPGPIQVTPPNPNEGEAPAGAQPNLPVTAARPGVIQPPTQPQQQMPTRPGQPVPPKPIP